MPKNHHLFLVDGSGYIFRAYHALPPLTRKSDGLPIGALAGFCNMLWKLLCDARDTAVGVVPSHFAVIFDYSARTFRKEIYPEYKANREAPPDDLIPQFALIRQATQAFNLPCIEKEGFEADDIIATYAKLATSAGMRTTIISSDKDLMQLVNDHVDMYDSMKDKHIGRAQVIEKWGVGPEKMIELQALTGDSSDNVPGIPGIGPKTAALLLQEYGSLDNLLANVETIKQQKRRENIIAYREQLQVSRQLVKLKDDVPLDLKLEDLVLETQNGPRIVSFLKAMELNVLTRRIAEATNTDAAKVEAAQLNTVFDKVAHGPDFDISAQSSLRQNPQATNSQAQSFAQGENSDGLAYNAPQMLVNKRKAQALASQIVTTDYETILDKMVLAQWLEDAVSQGYVAFNIETTSHDPMKAELIGFSLALAPGKAAYVPLGHIEGDADLLGGGRNSSQLLLNEVIALLKPVLENPALLKITHDIKFNWLVMQENFAITIAPFDDTMLISYALDAGSLTHGIDVLSQRWLGHTPMSYKEVTSEGRTSTGFDRVPIARATAYAGEVADLTLRLWQILKPSLVADGVNRVYEALDRPLVEVLARMEQRGVLIDRQILSRLSGELAQSAAALESDIYQLAGERFNIGSPKQLGEILYGKLAIAGGAKTKTGQWSTSAQVLEELAGEGNELARKIVDWRQLTKLKSTYTDSLPGYVDEEGRVHTNYSMAATTTGRLSSSDPNLQNIPIRTKEGRKIRTAFIAGRNSLLLSADYSQIELRILAHIADIPALKQAFADGLDIHAMTASEMFDVPVKDMPAEIRRRAKAINFGIIYGISAFGLANQLSISREEAGQYIRTYFERFPGIRDYMEETKAYARDHGYVETIFGRRAHYPEIRSSKPQIRAFNERAAINARIQGSAADIIRRAMKKMDGCLQSHNLSAKMLLQVHDELVFELPENEVEATLKVVKDVMENATMPVIALDVPLKVEARAAKNWDEAH